MKLIYALIFIVLFGVGCSDGPGSDPGSVDAASEDRDTERPTPMGDGTAADIDGDDGTADVGGRDGTAEVGPSDTTGTGERDGTGDAGRYDGGDVRDAGDVRPDTDAGMSGDERFCTDDGWCWYRPKPHGKTIRDLWVAGENDIYAVGNDGLVMHDDGSGWAPVSVPADADLHDIWPDGGGGAWVVGKEGTILRYDGSRWSASSSPVGADLYAVWGTGPNQAWAGGDGAFLKWNGTTWKTASFPEVSSQEIHAIRGSGADDFWAGGFGWGGMVRHWDGQSWSDDHRLPGIGGDEMTTTAFAEASGGLFTVTSEVFRRQSDGTFADEEVPVEQYYPGWAALHDAFSDGSSVWVVGRNQWARWKGGSWTTGDAYRAEWLAVDGSSASNVWAGGTGGRTMEWTGSSWKRRTGSPMDPTEGIGAVGGTGPNDAWALGSEGRLLHWNGTKWTTRRLPDEAPGRAYGLWTNGSNDVWLLLEWQVWRWNGQTFRKLTEFQDRCSGIWGSSASDVWVACEGGARHYDGSSWSKANLRSGDEPRLSDVGGSGPNNVWVVGNSFAVYRYDGNQWTEAVGSAESSDSLTEVEVNGPNDVWAAGSRGKPWHWDGTAWNRHEMIDNTHWVDGMWSGGSGNVWLAVTALNQFEPNYGTVFHWDGSSWTEQDTGVGKSGLGAIWGDGRGGVWAVGGDGTIIGKR